MRVLLGSLDRDSATVASAIAAHYDINYLVVELQAGAQWRYDPPAAHDVAWVFGFEGGGQTQGGDLDGDLVVLDERGAIVVGASTVQPRSWSERRVATSTRSCSAHPPCTPMRPLWRPGLDGSMRSGRACGRQTAEASCALGFQSFCEATGPNVGQMRDQHAPGPLSAARRP